jgi:hypothetical protein
MVLGDIVDTSRDSSDLSGFGQSAQCLIHGSAIAQVIECLRVSADPAVFARFKTFSVRSFTSEIS